MIQGEKKISKKEGEEVKKTSMNIFDWFYEKQVSPGASLGSTSSDTSLEPASTIANMEVVVE